MWGGVVFQHRGEKMSYGVVANVPLGESEWSRVNGFRRVGGGSGLGGRAG